MKFTLYHTILPSLPPLPPIHAPTIFVAETFLSWPYTPCGTLLLHFNCASIGIVLSFYYHWLSSHTTTSSSLVFFCLYFLFFNNFRYRRRSRAYEAVIDLTRRQAKLLAPTSHYTLELYNLDAYLLSCLNGSKGTGSVCAGFTEFIALFEDEELSLSHQDALQVSARPPFSLSLPLSRYLVIVA